MATGEDALAGKPESDITWRFSPDQKRSRTIFFKGLFLQIANQNTNDEITREDHTTPTTTYAEYEVPVGYTCYVRAATVYFKV